jgi:hypothetical protein
VLTVPLLEPVRLAVRLCVRLAEIVTVWEFDSVLLCVFDRDCEFDQVELCVIVGVGGWVEESVLDCVSDCEPSETRVIDCVWLWLGD